LETISFPPKTGEVWCDWNPAESDVEEIAQGVGVGEAICTRREVVVVVDRSQDIENEEAMSFFAGLEGDADESQCRSIYAEDPRIDPAYSPLCSEV
jgi:hypothetical protein